MKAKPHQPTHLPKLYKAKPHEFALALFFSALMVFNLVPVSAWAEVGNRAVEAMGASSPAEQGGDAPVDPSASGDVGPAKNDSEGTLQSSDQKTTAAPVADVATMAATAANGSKDDAALEAPNGQTASQQAATASVPEDTSLQNPANGCDGLVTKDFEGLTVTKVTPTSMGYKRASFSKLSDKTHNGHTIYKSDSASDSSDIAVTASEPCYMVFDYILSSKYDDTKNKYANSNLGISTAASYDGFGDSPALSYEVGALTGNNTSYGDFDESNIDEQSWRTGVLCLTQKQIGLYVLYERNKDDQATNKNAYLSNIRFYKTIDELPQAYKAHVKLINTNDYGTLSSSYFSGGNAYYPGSVSLGNKTEFDVPLYSKLTVNLEPFDKVALQGWDVSGTASNQQTSNEGTLTYTPLASETLTATLKAAKYADYSSINVTTSGGESDAEPQDITQNGVGVPNWPRVVYGDEETSYTINVAKPKAGVSLSITDNKNPVTFDDKGDSLTYTVTPGTKEHFFAFTFEQDGHTPATFYYFLMPTHDLVSAFGKDGVTEKIINECQSVWYKKDGASYTNNDILDYYNKGVWNETSTFLFNPRSKYKDAKHPIVFECAPEIPGNEFGISNLGFYELEGMTGVLSLDYMVTGGDQYSLTMEANTGDTMQGIDITGTPEDPDGGTVSWKHAEIPISGYASLTLTYENLDNENFAAISNVKFLSGEKTLSVGAAGSGAGNVNVVDASGSALKEGEKNCLVGQTLTLTATPNADSVFAGWYKTSDVAGKTVPENVVPLSSEAVYKLSVSSETPENISAVFVSLNNNVAQIGPKLYGTLEDALAASNKGDVVRLLVTGSAGYQLFKDATVPAGVTLLIPSSATDSIGYDQETGYNPDGAATTPSTGASGKLYSKLVIPEGKTLTVNGTVLVNAITGRPQAGHFDQDVNGGYAQVDLAGDIIVGAGGALDVCGYVKGTGTVTVEPKGKAYDLYVVRNWRGGSQAFAMFSNTVYPMNETDMHNIEVPTVIKSGGSLVGTVKMYADQSYHYTHFPQVDNANGLIRLTSDNGYVVKTYKDGKETYEIHGGADFAESTLEIVGTSLSTKGFIYPWDGDIDWILEDGNYTFSESFKFMPGASIEAKGAQIMVADGQQVVLYDHFDDVENTDNTQYPAGRQAATLSLDAASSFTNNGSFAGTITTQTSAINAAKDASWTVTTQEANGYCNPTPAGGEVKSLTFTESDKGPTLGITREGYTWSFGGEKQNQVVWDGADYSQVDAAISDFEQKKQSGETAGWTAERLQAVEDAIAKAKEGRPLSASAQAQVNDLAKAINNAMTEAAKHENLRQLTVTFDPAGGTFAEPLATGDTKASNNLTRKVTYGDAIGDFPTATKPGYVLGGWQADDLGTVSSTTQVKEDLTLKASWNTTNSNLTFNLAGGHWPQGSENFDQLHKSYTVEDTIEIPNPQKEGATFKGWQINSSGDPVLNAKIEPGTTGNRTYTAIWDTNAYTVTWNFYDGKSTTTQVKYGEALVPPQVPERAGYRFAGWKTLNANGLTLGDDGYPKTMPDRNDLTIEAQWADLLTQLEAITDFASGNNLNTARTLYLLLTSQQKDTYDNTELGQQFKAAVKASEEAAIDKDLKDAIPQVNNTLKGIAELTVDQNDKSGRTILVKLTAPATKAKALLTKGFLSELFGSKRVNKIYIDGEESTKNQTQLMLDVAWAAFGKDDYKNEGAFKEWLKGQQDKLEISVLLGTSVSANLVGPKTAEGITPEALYTVSFWDDAVKPGTTTYVKMNFQDPNGTTLAPTISKRQGDLVSRPSPDPTKAGYDFVAWYATKDLSGSPYEFSTMPGEDLTLYAKWAPHTMTLTFDPGTSAYTGKTPSQQATYDQPVMLPACGFTRTGYDFAGWKAPDGTIYQAGQEGVKNLASDAGATVKLVAQWTPKSFEVTFDPTSGKLPEGAQKVVKVTYDKTYGDAFTGGKLPVPTCEGYRFEGWFDGQTQITEASPVKITGPQTLKAEWALRGDLPYEVHYWLQNTNDDNYTEDTASVKKASDGALNSTVKAPQKVYEGFQVNPDKGQLEGTFTSSDPLILNVYYDRETHTVLWNVDGNVASETYRYGQLPTYKGQSEWQDDHAAYKLLGWSLSSDAAVTPSTQSSSAESSNSQSSNAQNSADATVAALSTNDATAPAPASTGNDAARDTNTNATSGTNTSKSASDPTGKANEGLLASDQLPEVTKDVTYVAKLDKHFEAKTVGTNTTWRTLHIAMSNAKPKDVVALVGNITLAADLRVPAGVELLVPYCEDDKGYAPNYQGEPAAPTNDELKGTTGASRDAEAYSTLTVPLGKTLTVEGTVLVNALIGRPAAGHYDQDMTGGWGHLIADGSIVVAPKGVLDAHGSIDGSGSVRAERGGTVGDLFIVRNWRGGSQASAMYSHDVYPYNEYDCHNITVPVTIEAGGSLEGLVTMYAADAYYATRFPLVDPTNGLIRQTGAGSLTRTYDQASGRERWAITGGAALSRSTLMILDTPLSTGDFIYPIDGDIDLVCQDGPYSFVDDYKFLPGATLSCQNAQVTVAQKNKVVFYDSFHDPANTDTTAYPSRAAATLTLDAASSLTNEGTFAGQIHCVGKDVFGTKDAQWQLTTQEANGYYDTQPIGQETQEINHTLKIVCPGHEWKIARDGRILWDGEADEPIGVAIEKCAEELAQEVSSDAKSYSVEASEGDGKNVVWTVDIAESALDEVPGEVGYDLMDKLLGAFHTHPELIARLSTLSGSPAEETYLTQDEPTMLTIRLFAQRLGLVDASAPTVSELAGINHASTQALATPKEAPTAADLVGRSAKLLITSVTEEGQKDPATIELDLIFSCTARPDLGKDEQKTPKASSTAVYRLYNPWEKIHLYTADAHEAQALAQKGWNDEGIAWYAPAAGTGDHAIARLYNPYSGDHYYLPASDKHQLDALEALGWKPDSQKSWIESAPAGEGIAVHTLFNPWNQVDTHLWTTDEEEVAIDERLGWQEHATTIWSVEIPESQESSPAL